MWLICHHSDGHPADFLQKDFLDCTVTRIEVVPVNVCLRQACKIIYLLFESQDRLSGDVASTFRFGQLFNLAVVRRSFR